MNWDVQSERQLFGHHSIPHSLPVSFVYTTIRKNLFWVVINFIFHAVPPYRRLYYSKQAALSRGVCFSQSVLPEALGDRVLFLSRAASLRQSALQGDTANVSSRLQQTGQIRHHEKAGARTPHPQQEKLNRERGLFHGTGTFIKRPRCNCSYGGRQ